MGIEAPLKKRKGRRADARWPFDPLLDPYQPGDHEPVRRGDVERVQKQAGARRKPARPA